MAENASPDQQLASLLISTMTLHCVRNTMIQDIHAGLVPVTRTGDYTDVTVIDADGRRIPWLDVSHFNDDAMRNFMRQVVDRLYTFQVRAEEPGFLDRIGLWLHVARRCDDPQIDESFLAREHSNREDRP